MNKKIKRRIFRFNTSLIKVFGSEQFVNFTTAMSKRGNPSAREAAFALAALMEIPFQYKATLELGLLGYVCPPPRTLPRTFSLVTNIQHLFISFKLLRHSKTLGFINHDIALTLQHLVIKLLLPNLPKSECPFLLLDQKGIPGAKQRGWFHVLRQ